MDNTKKWRGLLFAAALTLSGVLTGVSASAQGIDSTVQKAGHKIEKAGHKAASTASKGASAVADKVYKGKEGPNGETVYIDKKDRKYYIDEKGKKVRLKEEEIRDKTDTDGDGK
ncbi:hypothetical protein [Compostibacter hankyongensis]